jgi:membrane-associated HD superfamily phosphohydrolase
VFIPRTLAELDGTPAKGALGRAVIVIGLVTAALFLILNANITLGQENLEAGEVATRDIRSPREHTFDSRILTDEAREAAAADVPPITARIKVPADNRDDQLSLLESLNRRVGLNLERLDSGMITENELLERLAAEEEIALTDRSRIASLTRDEWDQVVAAAATALETTLQEQIL